MWASGPGAACAAQALPSSRWRAARRAPQTLRGTAQSRIPVFSGSCLCAKSVFNIEKRIPYHKFAGSIFGSVNTDHDDVPTTWRRGGTRTPCVQNASEAADTTTTWSRRRVAPTACAASRAASLRCREGAAIVGRDAAARVRGGDGSACPADCRCVRAHIQ